MNREISVVVPKLAKNNIYDEIYVWETNINGTPRLVFKHIDGVSTIIDAKLWREFLKKAN